MFVGRTKEPVEAALHTTGHPLNSHFQAEPRTVITTMSHGQTNTPEPMQAEQHRSHPTFVLMQPVR
jgi:hypothetical protein